MKYIQMFETYQKKIVSLEEFKFLIYNIEDLNVNDYLIILPNNQTVSFEEYIDKGYNIKYPITNDHIKSPNYKKNKVPDGFGSKRGKLKDWGE